MARIRSDKPEAYQSETLAEISLAAERTFKGMATIADDRGRLADKPAQINGELWSMRGNHSREELDAELGEMASVGLVCRYTGCDGKRYLHMTSWDRHQKIDRPSKSRLPRCPRHQGGPDDCGKHDGDCKPPDSWTADEPSRDSREPSRGLQPAQNGLDAVADAGGTVREGVPVVIGTGGSRESDQRGPQAPDQGQPESSRDSREPSMQDLGSRILDRGSRTVDLVPPPAGANKPRRGDPSADAERAKNVGDVVGAFVDGAVAAGQPPPASSLRARVGKQARALLADGYGIEGLIASARNMGVGEWNDLAVQVRKDAAAATGSGRPAVDRRQQATNDQFDRAMERARAREASQ